MDEFKVGDLVQIDKMQADVHMHAYGIVTKVMTYQVRVDFGYTEHLIDTIHVYKVR